MVDSNESTLFPKHIKTCLKMRDSFNCKQNLEICRVIGGNAVSSDLGSLLWPLHWEVVYYDLKTISIAILATTHAIDSNNKKWLKIFVIAN